MPSPSTVTTRGEDGEEDEEDVYNERHILKVSRSVSDQHLFRSSFRAMEERYLTAQEDVTRSIGGRLGGHFDSPRSVPGSLLLRGAPSPMIGEGTPLLVGPNKPDAHKARPKLVVWILPALLCAASYAFYNIFIKKGSASINPILGGVVLQFVAAILGTVLISGMLFAGDAKPSEIHCDRKGFMWSVCAGLAVGTAEMLSFCVSGMGVAATQFIPVIIGGSVMFGAILGLLVLGEKMKCHGWSGVCLLVTGIAMVATDPGEKVEEGGGGHHHHHEKIAPPLIIWIGPALVCASAYAFYNIFIKKGSASINPILGGVILQFVAAIFGTLLLVVVRFVALQELEFDQSGIFWACCAGIAVGTAEMLSFCVSGMGVQATQSIPIIIGGSVMFGAVLGLLMLGETLMFQGWSGVFLLMIGIALVATDPGEKVAGH